MDVILEGLEDCHTTFPEMIDSMRNMMMVMSRNVSFVKVSCTGSASLRAEVATDETSSIIWRCTAKLP